MSRAAAFPDSLVGRQGDAGSEAKSPTDQVPHRIGQGRRPGLHCLGRPSLCRWVWDEGDAGRQEGVQVHIPKCASAATLAASKVLSAPVGGGCPQVVENPPRSGDRRATPHEGRHDPALPALCIRPQEACGAGSLGNHVAGDPGEPESEGRAVSGVT